MAAPAIDLLSESVGLGVPSESSGGSCWILQTPLESQSGCNCSAVRAAWEAEKQRQGVGLDMGYSRRKGKERKGEEK